MATYETPILLPKEAAAYVRVSQAMLSLWRTKKAYGGPPYVTIGNRKIGYRKEDLDGWLANRVTNCAQGRLVTTEGEDVSRVGVKGFYMHTDGTAAVELRDGRRVDVDATNSHALMAHMGLGKRKS